MKLARILSTAAALLAVASTASAQTTPITQTQTVDITVSAVNTFVVNSGGVTLTASTVGANAGLAGGTYSVSTNETGKKITGKITAGLDYATANFLQVTLGAPSGAAGVTDANLTTTATDLVTGIANVSETGLTITYKVNTTQATPAGAQTQRTITYTFQ